MVVIAGAGFESEEWANTLRLGLLATVHGVASNRRVILEVDLVLITGLKSLWGVTVATPFAATKGLLRM
jgi:hypothetical protein